MYFQQTHVSAVTNKCKCAKSFSFGFLCMRKYTHSNNNPHIKFEHFCYLAAPKSVRNIV